MKQVSPQTPAHCLYSVQYVYSSVVHSVNYPDNDGETGEYFCIYCTFVTKKRHLFALSSTCKVPLIVLHEVLCSGRTQMNPQ